MSYLKSFYLPNLYLLILWEEICLYERHIKLIRSVCILQLQAQTPTFLIKAFSNNTYVHHIMKNGHEKIMREVLYCMQCGVVCQCKQIWWLSRIRYAEIGIHLAYVYILILLYYVCLCLCWQNTAFQLPFITTNISLFALDFTMNIWSQQADKVLSEMNQHNASPCVYCCNKKVPNRVLCTIIGKMYNKSWPNNKSSHFRLGRHLYKLHRGLWLITT